MSPDFELVLEDCLARMHAGHNLEECLADHPGRAEELRPLLSEAASLRAIPTPKARPAAMEDGRRRMLAAFEQQNRVRNSLDAAISKPTLSRYAERTWKFIQFILFGRDSTRMKFALRLAIDFVVVLALAAVLTVNASASTIPGDPLYGVKRTWEEVHLALTVQEPVRHQLQAQMVAERRAEIGRLLQLHRNIVVEFDGVLEQITVDQIVVSGIEINITPQTVIEGIPVVGREVEIRVSVQSDGKLIAQELHFEDSGSRGKATSTATVIPPIVPPGLPGADDDGDDDGTDDDDGDDDYGTDDDGRDDDDGDDDGQED